MTEKAKQIAKAYGRYWLVLGGATIAFMAGFFTCYAYVLILVVARFS